MKGFFKRFFGRYENKMGQNDKPTVPKPAIRPPALRLLSSRIKGRNLMAIKTINYECQCENCEGTGLYCGMGEHDGFAVVCKNCGGTGKKIVCHTYKEFEGKKRHPNCRIVLETNPGYGVGGSGDFGGMPYEEWLKGKPFLPGMEMRKLVCPQQWFQSANYKKSPNWIECEYIIKDCSRLPWKEQCWERYDKQNEVTW